MPDEAFDIAVFGSTPMAGLLAGLLKSEHGKRVCLVADPWSPFRLPCRYDLSVAPATRPETWWLLRSASIETMKLLGTLGKGLIERIDPLFIADVPASARALAHMRHMALGYGYAAERPAGRSLPETGAACRIRDAAILVGGRIEPALAAWHDRLELRRLPAAATSAILRRDGSARLSLAGAAIEADQAVLADDAAILARLDPDERDRVLHVSRLTVFLTEPAKPLPAPLVHYLDRDVVLLQRSKGGAIVALAGGGEAEARDRAGACLGPLAPLLCAGQTGIRRVATLDGAPLVGVAKGRRIMVLAGMGPTGAFLAPALARHLAGVVTEAERSYFTAREPARGNSRQLVADYAAPPLEALS